MYVNLANVRTVIQWHLKKMNCMKHESKMKQSSKAVAYITGVITVTGKTEAFWDILCYISHLLHSILLKDSKCLTYFWETYSFMPQDAIQDFYSVNSQATVHVFHCLNKETEKFF
jgi:galactose-1-phosphate uridylyltransferase